jgi:hypothetical protein
VKSFHDDDRRNARLSMVRTSDFLYFTSTWLSCHMFMMTVICSWLSSWAYGSTAWRGRKEHREKL